MSGFAERFIEQGKQQGVQQGIQHQRHMLARQVHKRFGAEVADESASLLERIVDPKQLDDFAEVLLDSPDGEAWLQALRVAAG